MKKILLFIALLGIFAACSTTLEQKAETLLENEIKASLDKPDTYKAIKTEVDSAYSPQDDAELFRLLSEIAELNQQLNLTVGSVVMTGDIKDKIKSKTERVAFLLMQKKEFVGYKVRHTFSAENNLGEVVEEQNIYLLNMDMGKVVFSMKPEDYAQLQDAIERLKEKFRKRLEKETEE